MNKKILLSLLVGSIFVITSNVSMANNSLSGWQYTNSNWYYYKNGNIVTGWIRDNTKWYYISDDGSMLSNTITPDGYTVDSSGAWVPDARKYWNIDFSEDDIDRIEFYFIPVPAAVKKKIITSRKDILKLYNTIVNSTVTTITEIPNLVGGGYKIVFIKKDQSQIVLDTLSGEITYNYQSYFLKNNIEAEQLWNNMNYAEISVSQYDIP